MSIFNELIEIDENGTINYAGWVEWKHISSGLLHCPVCLVLNGCWFNNALKPALPQHEKCHCVVKTISKPIANINSHATCDIRKFTDYIFSDKYAWNGKRDLFEFFGFTIENSQYLKEEPQVGISKINIAPEEKKESEKTLETKPEQKKRKRKNAE